MIEVNHESLVSETILGEFSNPMGSTMMNHAFNNCSIEQYLSVASVLWPKIVEVNTCIFIGEFYNGNYQSLEQQFAGDKKKIEQHVNTWSLGEFFLLSRDESVDNDVIFDEFCKVVRFFWTLRVRELFPGRRVVIETGEELYGESGIAITMYQE